MPAENDGFIVLGKKQNARTFGEDDIFRAAFSNARDLIAWLAKQHNVPFGGFDVPAEKIQAVKGALVGEKPSEGRLVPRGMPKPSEPDSDGWIEWKGGERAPLTRGVPVYVRHRSGKEYPTKVYEGPASRWTWDQRDTDIVAYRPVPWKGLDVDPKFDALGFSVPN